MTDSQVFYDIEKPFMKIFLHRDFNDFQNIGVMEMF